MANLADIIPAFMIGPNGQRLTPEQIRERHQIAQSLMGQATDTSPNAGGVASILAKGVQGFAAGRARNQADAAAGNNAKASSANVASLLGLLGGGSAAPVGQGATVSSPMVAPVQSVASAGSPSGLLPASFLSAVDKTEGGGAYDTLYGHAQKNGPFAGTSISSMPIRDVIAFTDPSGAYAQSVKAQIGRVATPVGRYQVVGSTLKNAVGALGLDPNAPFDQTAQDNVALYLAKNRVSSANTQQGKIAALRNEWHGFKSVPDSQMAQIVADLESSSTPAAAMQSAAPASGYVDPMVRNVSQQQPQQLAAPIQPAQAAPPSINPAIVEALSSPYASEQERSVAGLLLNQTMSQQQAAQEKALKQQERQQEIVRRQQIAQQSGIDPAYAQDDELWKGATGQIFAAPSTSTVNNTVIDNRTGKPIYQAPAQNYRQITGPDAAAIGLDPSKAYNVGPDGKIAPIGDSGVTVNNNMGGDKFGEEFAKLDAKALDTVATSGQAAQRNLGRINQLGELLKSSPSGWQGAFAQKAGEWGIKTEGLDTLQAAQAAINSLVPEQRQPGSGPMSDADLALFKQSLPRIINQPGGNDLIINTMKSIAQYDAEGANIVQQLRSGKIDRAKAFEALQNRVNPLDSFKVPGAPEENPMPDQKTETGWKDLGNGVKIRPKGSN